MPDPFYFAYFCVLLIGAVCSGFAWRSGDKRAVFMLVLFVLTLAFEILMLVLEKLGNKKYLFLVNVFALVEYTLFCNYIVRGETADKIKKGIWLSILLFLVFSVFAACLVTRGKQNFGWITWNIDLEGFLLFIVFTYALFHISDEVPLPIYRQPDFWVAIGVLIFYGGVFVMLGVYPVLMKFDAKAAAIDYSIILRPLNIVLYLCIIGGNICYIINRKYLIR